MDTQDIDSPTAKNFSSRKLKIVHDKAQTILKESKGRLSYHHTHYRRLEALDGKYEGRTFYISSRTEKTFKNVLAIIMSQYKFSDYKITQDKKYKFFEWLEK